MIHIAAPRSCSPSHSSFFFFFNDTATTEIYTLSLHDALPIFLRPFSNTRETVSSSPASKARTSSQSPGKIRLRIDRKSTRLNSSHQIISYAVFCLKKKKCNIYHRQASRQTRHRQ